MRRSAAVPWDIPVVVLVLILGQVPLTDQLVPVVASLRARHGPELPEHLAVKGTHSEVTRAI